MYLLLIIDMFFCCNQLVVKTVKVVANYSSYCYYVCISLSFFILIFFHFDFDSLNYYTALPLTGCFVE